VFKQAQMIWGCVAILAVVLVVAGLTGGYSLLFLIPCTLMMGAMMWMMMGGSRRDGA